jgi:hypothetical protein
MADLAVDLPGQSTSSNNEAPVSTPEAAREPLAIFDVQEVSFLGNRAGKLSLFADLLRVEVAGQPACEVLLAESRDKSELVTGLFNSLVIKVPKKRSFQLDREVARAIQGWLGPPTRADLKLALKRRLAYIIPIGLLLAVSALPFGDLPFHPVIFIEGMVLVFIGLLSRLNPQRIYFLCDSIWFVTLAVTTTVTTVVDESWWWLIMVALQIALAISGIREYYRFAPENMAAEARPPDN